MRLLIATDVASEGINLHHECHNIIHYDLPWSIITLIQRNGRIDRYGQTKSPLLRYLMVHTEEGLLDGDRAIFQRLVEKVEEINHSTRQGESVLRLYDPEAEARFIAKHGVLAGDVDVLEKAGEINKEAADLESLIGDASLGDDELNAFLLGDNEETRATSEETAAALDGAPSRLRLYSDQAFLVEGYRYLSEDNPDYPALEESGGLVTLTAPKDLERRLGAPDARGDVVFGATAIALEAWPENSQFRLTADPRRVEQAIERARHLAGYWSKELLCSEQHPILQWIAERLVMRMGRGKAPLINSRHLEPGELCFCFVGQVCSNAGTPLIVDAHAILFRTGGRLEERPLIEALEAARFDQLVNTGGPPRTEAAEALVSAAVDASLEQMERSIKDRQESWRDVHLDAAHEPSTRLILVIEGVDA